MPRSQSHSLAFFLFLPRRSVFPLSNVVSFSSVPRFSSPRLLLPLLFRPLNVACSLFSPSSLLFLSVEQPFFLRILQIFFGTLSLFLSVFFLRYQFSFFFFYIWKFRMLRCHIINYYSRRFLKNILGYVIIKYKLLRTCILKFVEREEEKENGKYKSYLNRSFSMTLVICISLGV